MNRFFHLWNDRGMASSSRRSVIACALSVALWQPVASAASDAGASLVIRNATIVSTRDGSLAPRMDLLVQDGKISQIGAAGSLAPVAGATTFDAQGKFVVPGYLDMHVHALDADNPETYLDLMLAHGITGFRQMSGTEAMLAKRAEQAASAASQQPEALVVPGRVLVVPTAPTPDAVVAEIHRQKDAGADFIKVLSLAPPVYLKALEETKKLGLPLAGHIPPSMDPKVVATQGISAIEHLGGLESLLVGCSSNEAALREKIVKHPHQPPPQLPPEQMKRIIERMIANPVHSHSVLEYAVIDEVTSSYDEAKCRAQAKVFADNATWQIPTLIRLRTMQFGDAEIYRNDPDLQYVSASRRAMWNELAEQFGTEISTEHRQALERLFDYQLKLTKVLDDAGVPMLAGSDLGGQWVLPGSGLHHEFELLSEAGLTPLRILQMTTLNGAKFLGRESSLGAVEVGKDADLVLLDENPLADVKNLASINAVVRAGQLHARADLEALKKKHQ